MLTAELIDHNIPRLQLSDSVVKAKQLITDYKLSHLPVVSENKFLGLISEEDLLDVEEEKITIEHIQEFFLNVAILDHIHF
jgi:predicted transcriptional regulator